MAVEGELVLIGFAEAYAAIETAWSLRDAGYRVAAFARTANRPALRRVRNVDMYEVAPPEADAARTVEDLARLIARLRPAAFMPLDDATVWLASKLPEDVTVVGPTGDRAELALNKQLQLDAARAAGLPVPPTRVVEDPQELTDLDVPVVVKPARALYEVDGRLARPTGSVCANDEELRRVAADAWYTPLLVQPLLHGVGEGVFGLVGAHGPT